MFMISVHTYMLTGYCERERERERERESQSLCVTESCVPVRLCMQCCVRVCIYIYANINSKYK